VPISLPECPCRRNPTLPDGAPPYLLAGFHPAQLLLLQHTATATRAVLQKIHTKSVLHDPTVQNVADTQVGSKCTSI
jgi:hypothetical protein